MQALESFAMSTVQGAHSLPPLVFTQVTDEGATTPPPPDGPKRKPRAPRSRRPKTKDAGGTASSDSPPLPLPERKRVYVIAADMGTVNFAAAVISFQPADKSASARKRKPDSPPLHLRPEECFLEEAIYINLKANAVMATYRRENPGQRPAIVHQHVPYEADVPNIECSARLGPLVGEWGAWGRYRQAPLYIEQ